MFRLRPAPSPALFNQCTHPIQKHTIHKTVYALGLYVDAAGAKRALGKWRGQDVAAEQQAYDGARL
jgi:hypothetical protein